MKHSILLISNSLVMPSVTKVRLAIAFSRLLHNPEKVQELIDILHLGRELAGRSDGI